MSNLQRYDVKMYIAILCDKTDNYDKRNLLTRFKIPQSQPLIANIPDALVKHVKP